MLHFIPKIPSFESVDELEVYIEKQLENNKKYQPDDFLINAFNNANIKQILLLAKYPITYAIFEENLKSLIKTDFNINTQDKYGNTLLHYMVLKDWFIMVYELLEYKNIDINIKNNQGFSPIYFAVWKNQQFLLRLLIDKGANINILDKKNRTPLFYACADGLINISEILLESGALIDIPDIYKDTALHVACKTGKQNLFKLLIDNGANIGLTNDTGTSAMHIACRKADYKIVKLLLENGGDLKIADNKGITPESLLKSLELPILLKKGHISDWLFQLLD